MLGGLCEDDVQPQTTADSDEPQENEYKTKN